MYAYVLGWVNIFDRAFIGGGGKTIQIVFSSPFFSFYFHIIYIFGCLINKDDSCHFSWVDNEWPLPFIIFFGKKSILYLEKKKGFSTCCRYFALYRK